MITLSGLNKYDPQGMHKIYDKWAEIAKNAYNSKLEIVDFKNIDHIVFAGMGGSGALGDMFSSILSKTKIHVAVVKGYHLPNTVDSNTLVVTTSISGNTIETLSVLKSTKKLDCKTIAFSSGGSMEKYCIKNKLEYRNIPQLHSPRVSFAGFLYSILKVLGSVLPIKHNDILESINELEKTRNKIYSKNLGDENISLHLAEWISGIPVIYYPFGLEAVAIRFKNSLQENAKNHAMIENVVESSHNGIVSWEKKSIAQPILLEGKDDYIKTKERWKILKKYFNENKIDYREVSSVKGNILSKLINLIYLLDYSSIYCAVLQKTDPSPIRSIDFIKNRLPRE